MDPRYSVAGLLVGTLVGLTGVGGGSLLTPLLILGFGIAPTLAVGTDLLYSVPTKLYAFFLHNRRGNVDWRITAPLLWGGLPGALAGLALFWALRTHSDPVQLQATIKHVIGAAILLACAGIGLLWIFRDRIAALRTQTATSDPVGPRARIALVAGGAFVGLLVALTSVGSGSVTLPILAFALPAVALQRLVGADIAFAAFLIPVAAIGHLTLGDANWPMALSLLAGSLPGVWIGSKLGALSEERWLRPVVVGVLVLAGSRLI